MDWKKIYEGKKCTAEEAVHLIKSGDRVVFGHCIAEPTTLVNAMVANRDAYKNVVISHMGSGSKGEYTRSENSDHFRFEGWFLGGGTRKSVEEGQSDYVPVFFHEVPALMRKGILKVDVLMVMVSPPDEYGYCSTGVSSDYTMQAFESAKTVIIQVNEKMPYTYGETFIHVSQVDAIVESTIELEEVQPIVIGEAEAAIGKYCASLIEDGATLQLGIGAIPDAVLAQLKNKKNLGIHSEMIADGVVELFKEGVITGNKKNIGKRLITGTFLMGTRKLYEFAHKNPAIELRTVDYVNNPMLISKLPKLVSINSCLQVDFMGQIVADSIGTKQFSGVGGQVDFVRGAAMSLDGKGISIIAMTSVAKKKDGRIISKIVPFLDEGAAVTTSRNDADYVVTEYGIASLKGKNLKDRARALIKIAHPEFHENLIKQFENRFNVNF